MSIAVFVKIDPDHDQCLRRRITVIRACQKELMPLIARGNNPYCWTVQIERASLAVVPRQNAEAVRVHSAGCRRESLHRFRPVLPIQLFAEVALDLARPLITPVRVDRAQWQSERSNDCDVCQLERYPTYALGTRVSSQAGKFSGPIIFPHLQRHGACRIQHGIRRAQIISTPFCDHEQISQRTHVLHSQHTEALCRVAKSA